MKNINVLLIEPISKSSLKRFKNACKINNWKCDLLITKNNILANLDSDLNQVFLFDSLNQKSSDLLSILPDSKYNAVVPASEFAVPMAEELADKMELYHNPLDLVSSYRDKASMRAKFKEYGISQPEIIHTLINSSQMNDIDWEMLPYPVVVKPSEAAGSIMVKICSNAEDAKELTKKILEFKESRVTNLSFNNKALIEQAVIGPEYSIEVVVNNDKIIHLSVTTKIISKPPFCDEIGHIVGAQMSPEIMQQVKNNIDKLKNAWQIKNGVIHAEFKINADKIYFIEAAARIAGDMISELVELTYGFNLEEAFIKSRAGHIMNSPKLLENKLYGIRFIFDQQDVDRINKAVFILSSDMSYDVQSGVDAIDYSFLKRKGYAILRTETSHIDKLRELIAG